MLVFRLVALLHIPVSWVDVVNFSRLSLICGLLLHCLGEFGRAHKLASRNLCRRSDKRLPARSLIDLHLL